MWKGSNSCEHEDGRRRSSEWTSKSTTRLWLSYLPSTESFRSEGTEQDDDKVTKAGQSSTGQAGKKSRGHAEAHAQIRSSRQLGKERSCETTREILAKAKADPEQGIAGVQKALSVLRITTDVTRKSGDLKEEARDLHLQTAEMRSELNKKRVEKSLINDEVASRLIHEIGHRLRLRKRNS